MISIKTSIQPGPSPDLIDVMAKTSVGAGTRVSRHVIDLDRAVKEATKASKQRVCEIVYGEIETRLRGLAIAVNEMRRDAQNSREDEKLSGIANELFKLSRYSHNQLEREPGTTIQTPGS